MTRLSLVVLIGGAIAIGIALGGARANTGPGCPQSPDLLPICTYSYQPYGLLQYSYCTSGGCPGNLKCQYCVSDCGEEGYSFACVSNEYVCGFFNGCYGQGCA